MRMPELLIFGKVVALGAVLTEVVRLCFLASVEFGKALESRAGSGWSVACIVCALCVVVVYALQRQAQRHAWRVIASWRIDLLVLFCVGSEIDFLLQPQLARAHDVASHLEPAWAPTVLFALLGVLLSPMVRTFLARFAKNRTQLTFLTDVEVVSAEEDALGVVKQAEQFAETVLAAGAHPGLVFGVDGPWGVGKTSFINLAEQRWSDDRTVIVIKFQPLRYASEPDLAERFVKELCAGIRQKAFAPEFAPAANRYSRMLKGNTDLSFLGIKLTLEPSSETMDEMLENIDEVLEQLGRRLIIVIDDLDRLEPKLINNVLFTVRRTFNLKRALYILCYDTEMLIAGKDEGSRAREFLEKFITVKLSLFVDPTTIENFLKTDWKTESQRFETIPVEALDKLSVVTAEAAKLINGPHAKDYAPLLGDLRKVKRFVNAMLLMQMEKTPFDRSDFHPGDLVNLILLHLHFPGVFRRIYIEETDDRTGSFSARRATDPMTATIKTSDGLEAAMDDVDPTAKFLLQELFDVQILGFTKFSPATESDMRTRACFNFDSRNLENYLKLIVRFKVPLAADTYRLYRDAVDDILAGRETIAGVLSRSDFTFSEGDAAQDKLWRILVNGAYELSPAVANEAIDTLVSRLPDYSSAREGERSLRHRSIYSLVLLLDRAGFGAPRGNRVRDSADAVEIAERIFGKPGKFPVSLIDHLTSPSRGVLGWNDMMLFRLTCSIDRNGSVQNVYSALLRYENSAATVSGDVSMLALASMRRISQEVFRRFRQVYVDTGRSFLTDVNSLSVSDAYGLDRTPDGAASIEFAMDALRNAVKAFVIYQLSNGRRDFGIGTGVYDESGHKDGAGIRAAMQDYLIDVCFNPMSDDRNAIEFGDYCVRAVGDSSMHLGAPNALEDPLTGCIDRERLTEFWAEHRDNLRDRLVGMSRTVVTYNQPLSYSELPEVFQVLDSWVDSTKAE